MRPKNTSGVLEYNDIVANIIRTTAINHVSVPSMSNIFANQSQVPTSASIAVDPSAINNSDLLSNVVRRGMTKAEGPLQNERGLLYGLQQGISNQSLGASVFGSGHELTSDLAVPVELTAADMSLSTLYLHELHHRQVKRRGYQEMATRSIWQRSPVQELATLPEVRQERAPLLQHQNSSIRISRDT
ncbi:hypothetical protein PV326_010662 [Microctonus aethiopoides]|nr:hypothetical protein PV326_010662 [Microctonus aethiopoides]